ncbi:tetratricopeptide repeat protein [Ensifer soli]|uniref:tetratricopeptide repeat protein n=1 Tax=Ciceribacter sp. sgz301302 TaxID=3342379 RepID=UPI0035B7A2B5
MVMTILKKVRRTLLGVVAPPPPAVETQDDVFARSVRLGDQANAQRKWEAAAEHYRTALSIRPASPAIQVQFGHAQKEMGLLPQAEAAYRQAIAADRNNADGYLHLGHVLKLQGRRSDAIAAYKTATRLGIDSNPGRDARRELEALGETPPTALRIDIPPLLLEPEHARLVHAIHAKTWTVALEGVRGIANRDESPGLRLLEAQLLHVLGEMDEAEASYNASVGPSINRDAFAALKAFYRDCGREEEASGVVLRELAYRLDAGEPFDNLAPLLSELAALGRLDDAFSLAPRVFPSAARSADAAGRTAADVKRDRGAGIFPPAMAAAVAARLGEASAAFDVSGEAAQATLMRQEAEALAARP